MSSILRLAAAAVAASVLIGCPLGRPKEVDCGGLRSLVAETDPKLAPFDALDPAKATPAELQTWLAAIRDTRDALERDSSVNGDVKDARDQYRKALADLRDVVEVRGKGGTGPGAEIDGPRRSVQEKRQNIDRQCPKP